MTLIAVETIGMATAPAGRKRAPALHALPEGANYRDDGCKHAARCLECPWEACVLDIPAQVQRLNQRRAAIETLRRQGKSHQQIAAELGITERTVYRAVPAKGRTS